jgi:guanyl-specific ribonuclease Sa
LAAAAVWASAGCAPPAEPPPAAEAAAEQAVASGHHHSSHPSRHEGREEPGAPERPHGARPPEAPTGDVPEEVTRVLRSIDQHGHALEGYEGGRLFHNAGRDGEQPLPRTDPEGRPITYQEWDVHPKEPGVNRGAERLVTGSDGSAYFTNDHYRTFKKIR